MAKKAKETVDEDLEESEKKKISEEHEEESEIEEDIESWNEDLKEKLRNLNFSRVSNTLDLEGSSAPVLEKIASSQAGPVFIPRGPISSSSQESSGTTGEGDGITYLPPNKTGEDANYISSNEQIYKTPERFEIEQAGRGNINEFSQASQQVVFSPSRQVDFISQAREKVWRPERVDTENLGRQNTLDTEKEKYQKYDPKDFSGR